MNTYLGTERSNQEKMSKEDHAQGPAINDANRERGEECKKIKIWDDFQVKYYKDWGVKR